MQMGQPMPGTGPHVLPGGYSGYPAYSDSYPSAGDPMWMCFTAIAGQVRCTNSSFLKNDCYLKEISTLLLIISVYEICILNLSRLIFFLKLEMKVVILFYKFCQYDV